MREPFLFEAPLCAEIDTELFFPEQSETKNTAPIAKKICSRCPHKVECLEWAIENMEYGVWGGTTDRERMKMRSRNRKQSA